MRKYISLLAFYLTSYFVDYSRLVCAFARVCVCLSICLSVHGHRALVQNLTLVFAMSERLYFLTGIV